MKTMPMDENHLKHIVVMKLITNRTSFRGVEDPYEQYVDFYLPAMLGLFTIVACVTSTGNMTAMRNVHFDLH